ncbi:hypothetical protein TRVA0_014S01002 [Trichomonascus vanleenenianus]|uniref:uncharacterized protein n=1 Tax=Trichomonascus vanleenenianus TaxID=2268995 RepID=UPI003ECAF1F6
MRNTTEEDPISLIGSSPDRAGRIVTGAKRRRISVDFEIEQRRDRYGGEKDDNATRVSNQDTETDLDTPPEVDLSDSLSSSPLPQPPETRSLEMVVDENTASSPDTSANTTRSSRYSRSTVSTPPPRTTLYANGTPSPFLDKISPTFGSRSYRLSALKSSIEGMKRRRDANASPSRGPERRVQWTADHWKQLEHLITPLQLYNASDFNQLPQLPKFVAEAFPGFPIKEIEGRALAIARRQRRRIDTQIAAHQLHHDGGSVTS